MHLPSAPRSTAYSHVNKARAGFKIILLQIYVNETLERVASKLPANELFACSCGQNSSGGHSSIAELDILHHGGAFLEDHIHPTGDSGDIILSAE